MRLTVLGKSPSWQDAGGACSGYLIEEEDTRVLVDCGNGVFAKLREQVDYVDVDAVVISHLHADHFLDLVPYSYALTYAPRQQPVAVPPWPGTDNPARPQLHVPPGATECFRRVVGAWGTEDLIESAFDLREYEATTRLEIGDVVVTFRAVPHFMETYAMCLSAKKGSGRMVYGADTSPTESLSEFAEGAQLLVIEATLPRPERTGVRGHLTPAEAGEHAEAAGVDRVLLTHISDELDQTWARDEARRTFSGRVDVATEGTIVEV
ncbi:MAG: MBL fold metallo-hydrolase [Actinomycetota bacterium]|nr:MBL fold metallo-hydrolase [Actinomycetota bacterium]